MKQATRLNGKPHRTLAERNARRKKVNQAIDNAIITLICFALSGLGILYINSI